MLVPALALMLAQAAAPPQSAPPAEVLVTGERDERRATRELLDAVSPHVAFDEPLPRFTETICPGAIGLPAEAGQAIVDRIAEVAISLGLETGAPGCAPNILVAFVDDGSAFAGKLLARPSPAFASLTLAQARRVVAEPGAARGWSAVETLSRDGEPMTPGLDSRPGDPLTLRVSTASRLSPPFRRDIRASTVLIDRDAMAGRSLAQVADYAAMRTLADARTHAVAGRDTILALFTPDGDRTAPAGLTAFDRGYLQGLYAGRGDLKSVMKQGAIARRISQEREADAD
ncbi:hypothetical protein ACBY01_05805 [Sphingomonas sp. ac-8]|uniref:hypothetical protein n=1 Tax=Sphingomonas sp. ac-8 TaxID=3242977 RepID=UPI003A7F7B94